MPPFLPSQDNLSTSYLLRYCVPSWIQLARLSKEWKILTAKVYIVWHKKFLSHESVVILCGENPVLSETYGNQPINHVWLSQLMLLLSPTGPSWMHAPSSKFLVLSWFQFWVSCHHCFAVFLSSVFVQIEKIESRSHSLFMVVLIKSPLVLISSGFYVVFIHWDLIV